MRVFLFGNRGHASHLLEWLIQRDVNVIGICSRPERPAWRDRLSRLKSRFVHSHHYRSPFLDDIPPLKLAARNGIPAYSKIVPGMARDADLILVCGYHRLIPERAYRDTLAVNLHPGLLPKHRGGTPNRWVIRNGEDETGVTAHLLAPEFDTGPIVLQRKLKVNPGETWGELEARLTPLIIEVALDVICMARAGVLPAVPQEKGKIEKPMHEARVEWSMTAHEIERASRAMRPCSGAVARLNGSEIVLWDTETLDGKARTVAPGHILGIHDDGAVTVSCQGCALKIHTLLDRGRIVPAAKVFRREGMYSGWRM